MSLLREHGHPEAENYAVHKVWEESHFVVQRLNRDMATEAMLTQLAVGALLSKDGGREFNKTIERMTNGEEG